MRELTSIETEEELIQELIEHAFEEDVQTGDVTTNAIVDESAQAEAVWNSKQEGIVAGLNIAELVFKKMDPSFIWEPQIEDGDHVKIGTEILRMKGKARAILTGERIALNIVQRMSGIATMTREYVDAVGELNTKVLDTRKTVPGLRILDKYAVAAGGGTNHRMGLFDLAMIKDNHIVAAGGIQEAVSVVRKQSSEIRIEIETTSLDEVKEALAAGADIIMLDNMSNEMMSEAVALIDGKAETEASGNITLETIRGVAETGVDSISVGALTHSVKAFDISQELREIY